MISRFHYLTQDLLNITHQELVEIACENGIRWIQLRVKNKSYKEWLQIAKDVKSICDKFQAILIINDNPEICKVINANGVHLGQNDISIIEARAILGNDKIIGGTANNLQDIIELQNNGADYIGLGPYRFTETKQKLNKILGVDGYTQIIKSSDHQIKIPVIAIGGIKLNDVKRLMKTGIYGVAVSSAINLSFEIEQVIVSFLNQFEN